MTTTVGQPQGSLRSATRRLLVTVRDASTGAYRPVGFLSHANGRYSFAYLRRELQQPEFRPLPGLTRAVAAPIEADTLFPLFAERVISSRRPDREVSLTALGLPLDAAPMEVLARSHGHRVGDTIELLPAPEASAGQTVQFTFLTHGVRYLAPSEQDKIAMLQHGDPLRLVEDSQNPANPRALLVTASDGIRLGWVPDPLIDIINAIENPDLRVERANKPDVGYHFRLLVRLAGVVREGKGLFSGPDWETN